MNFDEYGTLQDNGDGTYTFISPDSDVPDVSFEAAQLIGAGVLSRLHVTPVLTSKNQDDYLVTDLSTFNLVEFVSTVDLEIKGIDSTGLPDGFLIVFSNGNTNGKKVKFKKNKNSSLASNRFDMNDDIELQKGEFWWFKYNARNNRWNTQAKL